MPPGVPGSSHRVGCGQSWLPRQRTWQEGASLLRRVTQEKPAGQSQSTAQAAPMALTSMAGRHQLKLWPCTGWQAYPEAQSASDSQVSMIPVDRHTPTEVWGRNSLQNSCGGQSEVTLQVW